MSDVVVIGSGFGGIMAAIRLRAAGRDVVVLERNESFGGKVATYERDGFTFDLGPSLLTLPRYVDDTLRLAGTSLSDEVDLVRLAQPFRYFWPDHSAVAFHDDPVATAEAIEAMSPGGGAQYLGFVKKARRIWEISERTFLAGEMRGRLGLLRRMRSPRDLLDIDAMRTLADAAEKTFDDPRLRQWAGRYATYSGSSPYEAPATLACIAAVEAAGLPWLVREVDGRIGAYAYATPWRPRSAYRFSVEVTVYVADDARGQGHGRALYTELFAQLKALGRHAVLAGITLPNDASIALHEAMGMTKVAHLPEVGFKFGRWLDVGYWHRLL